MSELLRLQQQYRTSLQKNAKQRFSVVLLGTGNPLPSKSRACASILVMAGNSTFLVDTGRGFLNNFALTGLTDVNAIFFTHYHSDHFGEFGEFMVTRTIWGATQPLLVIGPPGAKQTLEPLLAAYTLDNSYRKMHHKENWAENGMKMDLHEVQPGIIYDQDGVQVTMFIVDHSPVFPAVGYKFVFHNHVIVISGDTKKVSIMEEIAKGADLLVHEVANQYIVKKGQRYLSMRWKSMGEDVLNYHTLSDEVSAIAQAAGVKTLVLTHFVPGLIPFWLFERFFTRGMKKIYHGKIIIGRDGMQIKV